MEFLIYLDVCCLNRPFDDQTQERIRLEAEAVRLILERCQSGEWQLLGSEVIDEELEQTPIEDRKEQMKLCVSSATIKINGTELLRNRAIEIVRLGFKAFDASHIAFAEAGNADVLITTDDRMLRLARRHIDLLQVRVENPLIWMMEVEND
jgi:predicted nucleic acid-binding protein